MKDKLNELYKRFLILCPLVIVLIVFAQIFYITKFNQHVYEVDGGDSSEDTYISMAVRDDSTSTWLKRGFAWKGETIDLNASTFDGSVVNSSNDEVNDWTVRIDITEDCFVNNAWCGTVEVHQYVGTDDEVTQTIDLRKYNKDDLKVDYIYDGDLLIPLVKGDYIIYHPSQKDKEAPLAAESDVTVGVIFYYFDTTEFFDYSMEYTYHRSLRHGNLYYVAVLLILVWIIVGIMYIVSVQIYKDAERQLENKKSGLLCMSDIYFASYIIELEKEKLIPVIEKNNTMLERPIDMSADDQIKNLINFDADDAYRDILFDFCDLSTLVTRMGDKNSIACEYISKEFGWCSMRFFAMDKIEGRPLDRVLFTIQIIDAEKREMAAIEEEISRAKNETYEQSAFLEAITDDIVNPVKAIMEDDIRIIEQSNQESIRQYAREIEANGDKLMSVLDELVDYARLETNQMPVENVVYSIDNLVDDIKESAEKLLLGSEVELKFDIAPTVPKELVGDFEKIKQVIFALISNSIDHTTQGSITVSVFGRKYADNIHLVYSVRDTGDGTNEADQKKVGIKLAYGLLRIMDSKLCMVSTPGDGSEAYFEIETDNTAE